MPHLALHLSANLPCHSTDRIRLRVVSLLELPIDQSVAHKPVSRIVTHRQGRVCMAVRAKRAVLWQLRHRAGRERVQVEVQSGCRSVLHVRQAQLWVLRLHHPPNPRSLFGDCLWYASGSAAGRPASALLFCAL